jgi:hypothetical protein
MSCNICHTPILVDPSFLVPGRVTQDDHLVPIVDRVCPAKDQEYFRNVVQLDRQMEGVVMDEVVHGGRGVFYSQRWKICGQKANVCFQERVANGITTSNVLPFLCY